MVAINFSPQFAGIVASGAKKQTIRKKNRFRIGDRLQLYTGQRTKNCKKLIEDDPLVIAVISVGITRETISMNAIDYKDDINNLFSELKDHFKTKEDALEWANSIRDIFMRCDNLDAISRRDGFKSWQEMRDWFAEKHGLPFHGYLVKWRRTQ